MKSWWLSLTAIFLLTLFASFFILQPSDSEILAFGVIKHKGVKKGGVLVKVFQDDSLISSQITGRQLGYGFKLQYNNNYSVVFDKAGYLKQTVLINTNVNDEVLALGDRITWEPEFEIHKIMPGLEEEEFPSPIASYIFDETYWGFVKDKSYEQKAQTMIYNISSTLEELEVQAFETAKIRGDSLMDAGNYELALVAYNEAQQYQSEQELPKKSLKQTRRMLKKETSFDESYAEVTTKADEYLAEQNYEMANKLYEQALIYKPKEEYVADKMYEIDSIISYSYINLTLEYDSIIDEADKLFEDNMLDSSMNLYVRALKLFPQKKHPGSRLTTIDSLSKQPIIIAEDTAIVAQDSNQVILSTSDRIVSAPIIDTPERLDSILIPESNNDFTLVDEIPLSDTSDGVPVELIQAESLQHDSIIEVAAEITVPEFIDTTAISIDSLIGVDVDELSADAGLEVLEQALGQQLEQGNKDASTTILNEIGQLHQSNYNLNQALASYKQSLELSRELKNTQKQSEALNNIATVMYDSGSYQEAIENFEQSLSLSEEIENKAKSAEILENIATVYESSFRYDEAIEKLEESVTIQKELGNTEAAGDVMRTMGEIYIEQNDFDKAIDLIEKSLKIDENLQNKEDVGTGYNDLGAVYYQMNDLDKATEYYEQSLALSQEIENEQIKSISLNNLGNVSFEKKNYIEAIDFYTQSLEIKRELSLTRGIATTLYNIGNAHYELGEYAEALELYNESFSEAKNINYIELVWLNYKAFAKTYGALGRYKEAYENYKLYTSQKFESYGEKAQLVEMREAYESNRMAVQVLKRKLQKQSRLARYEAERNRREMQIVELENENKQRLLDKQRIIIVSGIIGSIIILLFLGFIFRQYRLLQKTFKIVAEQKRSITEGIKYAAKIQKAVLPQHKAVENILPEHFILYRPCEVVSGDFYWVTQHFNKTVVAVSDCTGHGVPGGFMSMLGIAFLNEILTSEVALTTDEILGHLRNRVVDALHQKGDPADSLDGMDISLAIFDEKTRELTFSAAYHTLFLIRNGELEKVKGDRVPIGYYHKIRPFTMKTIQLERGDLFYMTTDGYIDQIGEQTMNRFMVGPFTDKLLAIQNKPLIEQRAELDATLDEWRGKLNQTDDVLVFGLRVS